MKIEDFNYCLFIERTIYLDVLCLNEWLVHFHISKNNCRLNDKNFIYFLVGMCFYNKIKKIKENTVISKLLFLCI